MSRLWLLMALLLTALVARGAELNAWLDPDTVPAGKPFRLMIEATGSSVDDPILPAIDGVSIDPRPRIRQDQWSIVNFSQRAATKLRGYIGMASEPGTYTIPPVKVTIDGAEYSTSELTLTVTSGGSILPAPAGQPGEAGQGDRHLDAQEDLLRLEASVDKTEVYLNEPIVLTLKRLELYHHGIRIRGVGEVEPPTEGFYVLPLEQQGMPTTSQVEERNGWTYRAEDRLKVLFPTATGDLVVGPWKYAVEVAIPQNQLFYDTEVVEKASDPLLVHVKPLPPAPPAFTGAVGQFEATASLPQRQVMQGVPVTIEVRVRGWGNPNAIGFPRVTAPEGGSIADPISTIQSVPDPESPAFEKIFTYGLTLTATGPVVLPAFTFCYFDTEQEQYVTQDLGPFDLEVIPAGDQQHVLVDAAMRPEASQSVEVLGSDIRPLITDPEGLHPDRGMTPAHVAVVLAPPLLCGLFMAALARKRRFASDAGLARSHRARSQGLRKLRHVMSNEDAPSALYEALGGYLADKLGATPGAITSQEVGGLLRGCGVDEGTIEGTERILKACERARYAGMRLTEAEVQALTDAAVKAIDRVEAVVRKRRVRS